MRLLSIILLFLVSVSALPEEEHAEAEADQKPITWVDSSHAYATDRAQALTQWMDSFFGDPVSDLEQAESFLRAEFIDDWEEVDGHDFKARLRGKVQLPQISKRLNLVFSGEENGQLAEDERDDDDPLSLQYELADTRRSRFDLTLGASTSGLRPGVRFRYEDSISEASNYRFLERVQYESDEGLYSTTQLDLYRAVGGDNSLRWLNRVRYGEETDGAEWLTKVALRQRYLVNTSQPIATSIFVSVNGVTEPRSFTKNYRVGFLFRRQVYREFLFIELQPAYNFRKRNFEENRNGLWSILFKVEIALEKDLRRVRREEEG